MSAPAHSSRPPGPSLHRMRLLYPRPECKPAIYGMSSDVITPPPQHAGVSEKDVKLAAWKRVAAVLETARPDDYKSWLAHRLTRMTGEEFTRQQVYGWETRGLPREHWSAVAVALGKSTSWVAGEEPGQPGAEGLSPMALLVAKEFNRIKDADAALAAYTRIVGIIAIALDAGAGPPAAPPFHPPTSGRARDK